MLRPGLEMITSCLFGVCLLVLLPATTAQGFTEDFNEFEGEKDSAFDVSEAGKFAIAYLGKPFALLSMIGSYVMIREIFAIGGSRNPTNRMLVSMALANLLVAFGSFLGTWPSPADSTTSYDMVGNVGSQQFCTFQGFCIQLGRVSSVLSTAWLSVYYLWTGRRNWSDRDLAEVERYVLGFIWLSSLAASVYLIPLDLYNSSLGVCHIQSIPPDCREETCIRGSDPSPHQILTSVITGLALCASLLVALSLYLKVRDMKDNSNPYDLETKGLSDEGSSGSSDSPDNGLPGSRLRMSQDASISSLGEEVMKRLSKDVSTYSSSASVRDQQRCQAVAWKSIQYAVAFFATYCFAFLSQAISLATGSMNEFCYFIAFLIFLPSAGTFNFLVFARRRAPMRTPEGRTLRGLLFCTPCAACRYREVTGTVLSIPRSAPGQTSNDEDDVVVFVSDVHDGKEKLFKEQGNQSFPSFVGAERNRPCNDEDGVLVFEPEEQQVGRVLFKGPMEDFC